MNQLVKYGLIGVALLGFYIYNSSSRSGNDIENEIDLNLVLDITVDAIYKFEDDIEGQENLDADNTFINFASALQSDYNSVTPALYKTSLGVAAQQDASLLAFEDPNKNGTIDSGENALFLIEIDGENSRIIASSRDGAVNDHHFSGTSLLAGYLIGSMLSRQRGAGVNSKSLASKQPVTAKAAARSRAGSGSHSKGK
jgi:hypothetical protein